MVKHGPWVEVRDQFFCEGAWSGDFGVGGFLESMEFFGSGGCIVGGKLWFATATHTYERLHSIHVAGALLVSNSLAFLLAETGERLDPRYPFYDSDLMSFKQGIRRARRWIPTQTARRVHLHYCCNLQIDSKVRLKEIAKRYCDPFQSYAGYVGYLDERVTALCKNAADPQRAHTFIPLTSVSAGYDSPAASLFARKVGCREAVTFSEARPGYAAVNDSGAIIGRMLGFDVHEYSRTTYRKRDDCPEAEFLAAGTGGEEVVFIAVENKLSGRLFFTGYFGDAAWSRSWPFAGSEFRIRNPAGASFTEFRLRVGFINFALPVIGFVHQPRLHSISNSDELAPWWTGTEYDKPIPRRLLEEAGIPGHLFGHTKMAIAQPFYNRSDDLEKLMGHLSFAEFKAFTRDLALFPTRAFAWRFRLGRLLYDLNQRVNWKIEKYAAKAGSSMKLDTIISDRYDRPLRWNAYTFHWGMAKVLPRYLPPAGLEVANPAGRMQRDLPDHAS